MKKLVYVKKRINKQDSYKIDTDYLNYINEPKISIFWSILGLLCFVIGWVSIFGFLCV